MILAHVPALDVGGLCLPGATAFLKARPPGGKTMHSIELVSAAGPRGEEEEGGGGSDADAVLVGAHPRLGEALAKEVLRRGLLEGAIGFGTVGSDDGGGGRGGSMSMVKQRARGDSRVDFELVDGSSGRRAPIEVKNIVCADFAPDRAPAGTGPNHCVMIAESASAGPYRHTALFPWGRVGQVFEGQKVMSARAIKHLRNLVDLGREDKVQPIVLFVVNREDCDAVRACHEACPMFATELGSVFDNGVRIVSFCVKWTKDGKAFFDGVVPVNL